MKYSYFITSILFTIPLVACDNTFNNTQIAHYWENATKRLKPHNEVLQKTCSSQAIKNRTDSYMNRQFSEIIDKKDVQAKINQLNDLRHKNPNLQKVTPEVLSIENHLIFMRSPQFLDQKARIFIEYDAQNRGRSVWGAGVLLNDIRKELVQGAYKNLVRLVLLGEPKTINIMPIPDISPEQEKRFRAKYWDKLSPQEKTTLTIGQLIEKIANQS